VTEDWLRTGLVLRKFVAKHQEVAVHCEELLMSRRQSPR
jgi:hypothetical protein